MKIPDQFEFMSQQWRIRSASSKELTDCLGLCDPSTNTIILDTDRPDAVLLQTMFHEIIHAWEMTLAQCLTEQQVDTMSTSMIHFFKQNPEFRELLK